VQGRHRFVSQFGPCLVHGLPDRAALRPEGSATPPESARVRPRPERLSLSLSLRLVITCIGPSDIQENVQVHASPAQATRAGQMTRSGISASRIGSTCPQPLLAQRQQLASLSGGSDLPLPRRRASLARTLTLGASPTPVALACTHSGEVTPRSLPDSHRASNVQAPGSRDLRCRMWHERVTVTAQQQALP
jgi:hypothetical protein